MALFRKRYLTKYEYSNKYPVLQGADQMKFDLYIKSVWFKGLFLTHSVEKVVLDYYRHNLPTCTKYWDYLIKHEIAL